MTTCQELDELYLAYALDAVDDVDRQRIEQHTAQCAACAQVAAAYLPVADFLALSVPQYDPPADLKYRVLAAAMPKAKFAPASRPARIADLGAMVAALFRAPALSAVMLILIVGLGLWNLTLQNQMTQQATFNQQLQADLTRNRALVSIVSYADSQPKHIEPTALAPQAIGRVYMASELNTLALIVSDVPPQEATKAYQIWLIDAAGERTSGGMFTVDAQGRAWVLIRAPKPLGNYSSIGITLEPAEGSPKPTGPKMMGTTL